MNELKTRVQTFRGDAHGNRPNERRHEVGMSETKKSGSAIHCDVGQAILVGPHIGSCTGRYDFTIL